MRKAGGKPTGALLSPIGIISSDREVSGKVEYDHAELRSGVIRVDGNDALMLFGADLEFDLSILVGAGRNMFIVAVRAG
jgi:hypothetical protein